MERFITKYALLMLPLILFTSAGHIFAAGSSIYIAVAVIFSCTISSII